MCSMQERGELGSRNYRDNGRKKVRGRKQTRPHVQQQGPTLHAKRKENQEKDCTGAKDLELAQCPWSILHIEDEA